MTDKEKRELKDGVISIFKRFNILDHTATIGGLRDDILRYIDSLQEEPVSEELEEAAYHNCIDRLSKESIEDFKAGAKWQKQNLWKPADGEDLPELERDVIVLTQPYPLEGSEYAVSFGHRPNPDGWDRKSITTGETKHYTPETYDKGGWNIPNVKYWLDCLMPKEIEL